MRMRSAEFHRTTALSLQVKRAARPLAGSAPMRRAEGRESVIVAPSPRWLAGCEMKKQLRGYCGPSPCLLQKRSPMWQRSLPYGWDRAATPPSWAMSGIARQGALTPGEQVPIHYLVAVPLRANVQSAFLAALSSSTTVPPLPRSNLSVKRTANGGWLLPRFAGIGGAVVCRLPLRWAPVVGQGEYLQRSRRPSLPFEE
jgi:hypothetical protein